MAIISIYAGATATLTVANNLLPSPSSLKGSLEQIWSKDTGRIQSGSDKAMMKGDSIASKRTYEIQWGVLDSTEYSKVTSLLTDGFFYFGVGNPTTPPSSPSKYYRSEIQFERLQVGATGYYKNVAVTVIQQ